MREDDVDPRDFEGGPDENDDLLNASRRAIAQANGRYCSKGTNLSPTHSITMAGVCRLCGQHVDEITNWKVDFDGSQ